MRQPSGAADLAAIGAVRPLDPAVELSPFDLFQALVSGESPLLVDVRGSCHASRGGLRGAVVVDIEDPAALRFPPDAALVLFDEDGTVAVDLARRLQARGRSGVRALYGGLALWRLAIVPELVGDTFLA